MKLLKSWILDYVSTDVSDKDLIDKIIFSGTEVEGVFGELDPSVVVVEIKSIDKHPNADKLHTVIVNDGEKDIQIVCGAPNIEVGQKVPLAKPGTRIGDMEIAEATIRGVASVGMLCSEKELGIGEDHSGIKILSDDVPLGSKVSEILMSDIVLDLKPTPNRGDCFCHLGIAREIAATLGKQVEITKPKVENFSFDYLPKVEINDIDLCPRYGARIVRGIKIGPSTDKIANRLITCGIKPINNIVDITNYIMLDLGQPMHAFNAAKIKDSQIVVRRARDNEKILCLDNKERTLGNNNLVIADFKKPIAIAGIIGGKDSEITDGTVDIIFEAAEFDSKSVRKTSKNLEITTEASYRFERGIDSAGIKRALDKACELLTECCPDASIGKEVIVGDDQTPQAIDINHKGICEILGKEFTNYEIDNILSNLEFTVEGEKCLIPSFRHDIVDFRCLAEEVGRIFGYNNLPDIEIIKKDKMPERGDYYKKEFIKDLLVDFGFSEVYNYSFMSKKDIAEAGISDADLLEVRNPVQPENKYMRNSLIPGLLKAVAKNPTFDPALIFEMGNTFDKSSEVTMLGVVASGKDAKKQIDTVVANLCKISDLEDCDIKVESIERSESEKFKIKKQTTCIFEIETAKLLSKMNINVSELDLKINYREIHYRPVSKYPSVTRDLSFITNTDIESLSIIDEIYGMSNLVNRVELFDEFESEKFGEGKKNLAFHIYLQALDRTLNDQESDEIIKNIIDRIESTFAAKLRS